ncbi:MAG: hypothetical protein WCY21_07610 [Candidatus Cloacimonadaceae bacterium]|jgi:hypothetical protein|nr:hypothetical protein [Candidatus Cloacimonadota bacterium]MDX9950321.1 hypothetical protein [Candidatus Syntrophosphaera sp.]
MRQLSFVLILFLLFAGCTKKGDNPEKLTPLAEVDGDFMYQEAFRGLFTDEQWNEMSPEQRKREIENWVSLTLMAKEADALNLDKDPAVQLRMDFAKKKIKANALISQRLASINIGEEELFNYYRVHQNEFQGKLMEYDIQRLLCGDSATATLILNKIRDDGYDFNLAVTEYSQESLREQQGRMGFVTSDGPDSLFWRAAHELGINTAGTVNVNGKTYILRSLQQREGSQDANFGEYRNEIRAILIKERRQQVYDNLIRELKKKYPKIYYY